VAEVPVLPVPPAPVAPVPAAAVLAEPPPEVKLLEAMVESETVLHTNRPANPGPI